MMMVTAILLLAAQAGPQYTARVPPPVRVEARPAPAGAAALNDVDAAVRRADRDDRLTGRDVRRARNEASQLRDLRDRYAAGGLSDAEAREIETRAQVMESILNAPASRAPR